MKKYPNFHSGKCDKCGAHVPARQGYWIGKYTKDVVPAGSSRSYTYTYDIIRCSACMEKTS